MIQRLTPKLFPDPKRVLLQFFELNPARTKKVIQRVSSLDEKEVINILNKVFNDFSKRHKNFEEIILSNFKKVEKYIQSPDLMSRDRKMLIGSYFSKEYSISAAALFNPSMVPHPDQSKIEKDSLRFVMSLRATGEGHISSIEFREGIIDKNSEVHLQKKSRYITQPKIIKLKQDEILIEKLKYTANSKSEIKDLLDSNYICNFSDDVQLSERVLFPYSKSESVGMEDARFVRFNDKNDFTYFGTYTAYNGRKFRTQI